MPRGTFSPVTDMDRETVHGNPPGSWTDDTSMALCLAESLIEHEGMELADQLQRYVRWRDEGYLSSVGHCFDIGGTTNAALERFMKTGDPRSGGTGEWDAGNGSIMRLAPVPLFFASAQDQAIYQSAESSITTHATRESVDGCRYLAAMIHAAVNGAGKNEILSESLAAKDLAQKLATVASGSFKEKSRKDVKGSGYVVESLEAALWAFYNSDSFEEGALLAVNLGDDADTTGAVYGQLAGAYYGETSIPENWRATIAYREKIESYADRLYLLARNR